MQRIIIMAGFMLSVACFLLAYRWVIVFDPASPIVPFILCLMSGGLFVYVWQLLGDALDNGE